MRILLPFFLFATAVFSYGFDREKLTTRTWDESNINVASCNHSGSPLERSCCRPCLSLSSTWPPPTTVAPHLSFHAAGHASLSISTYIIKWCKASSLRTRDANSDDLDFSCTWILYLSMMRTSPKYFLFCCQLTSHLWWSKWIVDELSLFFVDHNIND